MLIPSRTHLQPLQEMDRFFAAARQRVRSSIDAQSLALDRLICSCERVRPHLSSVEALEGFIEAQHDPPRLRRRISVALALEAPNADLLYGRIGPSELERFRTLARNKPASVIWVFS
jgi:hypothetical protein